MAVGSCKGSCMELFRIDVPVFRGEVGVCEECVGGCVGGGVWDGDVGRGEGGLEVGEWGDRNSLKSKLYRILKYVNSEQPRLLIVLL